MVFSKPERVPTSDAGTAAAAAKSSATRLLGSVTALATLCAKKAGRVTRKLRMKPSQEQAGQASPRSPLARPKHMLKTISQSAMTLVHKRKNGRDGGELKEKEEEEEIAEWGDGGVWQRGILMGDKCQPLDFSGAIYYDSNGNKMNELPLRSPRASPLPGYLLGKAGS